MSDREDIHGVHSRLAALEASVRGIWERLDSLEKGTPAPKAPTPPPAPPSPPAVVEPVHVAPIRPAPEPIPGSEAPDLEWRFGATWLNRLGAVAILLAVAYFLSYSFQHGWITPAMRCLGGGAFSLALIGGGEWLRRRGQRGFSQGITGAGIGVAYVAAYAAHGFYNLIGTPAAFGLMTAATALSVLVAAWGDAQAVAVLGYLGGMLTPLLLRTGKDGLPALMPYLLLLACGAVYQGRRRGWSVVRWVAWAGSALLLTGWADQYLGSTHRVLFTVGVLALAFLFELDAMTRLGGKLSRTDAALLGMNALLATTGIYLAWDPVIPRWMGTLAVLGASVQAWAGWRGWKREPASPLVWVVIAHAAVLMAAAVPLQFDGKGVALGWAAQVLVAAWAGRRYAQKWLSFHAMGTGLLALGHLAMYELPELGAATSLVSLGPWHLSTPLAAILGVAGACLAGAVFLAELLPAAGHLLAVVASAAALSGTVAAFPSFPGTLPLMAWAGLLFAVASSRWEAARRHAWLVVILAAGKLWVWDILLQSGWKALAVGQPILNLRMVCISVSAAVFAFSGLADRKASVQARTAGILLGVVSLLGGMSLEIHRMFVGANPEPLSIVFDERFVFTAVWALGILCLAWACAGLPALRPAAWALAVLFVAKFWLSDIMLRGGWEALGAPRALASARTLAALGVAGMLAGLGLRDREAPKAWRGTALALASATFLGWISLEIHRAFIGLATEPPRLSDGEQIAHSAAWALGAAGAIALGFLRNLKPVRIGGLAGIGIVALKILVVDLADVAPIYRVGILFVLGVLSLGASYAYHKRGKKEETR